MAQSTWGEDRARALLNQFPSDPCGEATSSPFTGTLPISAG